jgi:hypothetical protein
MRIMVVVEFHDSGNSLRVECDYAGHVGSHLSGDLRINASVVSNGFRGQMVGDWVLGPDAEKFANDLAALERSRQGRARLESMDYPEAVWLEFRSIDKLGHMEVRGRLSHDGQSVEFEFEFCPSHLPEIVAGFTAMAHQPRPVDPSSPY